MVEQHFKTQGVTPKPLLSFNDEEVEQLFGVKISTNVKFKVYKTGRTTLQNEEGTPDRCITDKASRVVSIKRLR